MDSARSRYGGDLGKSAQSQIQHRIREATDAIASREYGERTIPAFLMAYGDEGTTLANFDSLYLGDAERLNHIFAEQVYGCAPTEIIYRICLRYILGFSDEIRIEKNNIRLCDTLEYAKSGTLEAEMKKLFDL